MNLKKKKILAAKTLKVGKQRIVFLESRIDEIKEAITKKDIQDLHSEGAILIKSIKGRRKNTGKSSKRSTGNFRKKVDRRKKDYVIITRKLRKYVKEMEKQEKITKKEKDEIRKKIRNKAFKSQANLKEYIKNLKK
jgi:ribosomal protein L19E